MLMLSLVTTAVIFDDSVTLQNFNFWTPFSQACLDIYVLKIGSVRKKFEFPDPTLSLAFMEGVLFLEELPKGDICLHRKRMASTEFSLGQTISRSKKLRPKQSLGQKFTGR